MGETDVTFRHLLRGLPRPILQLAFPRQELEPLGPLDPSVDRPRQRTVDSLFRVRDHVTEAAVHIEIERGWKTNLPGRMFDYSSAAVTATQLPVWSVVVLLRPGGDPPLPTGVHRIPGPGNDGDAFVFRYRVVPLWNLDARSMRRQLGIEAAPFCAAMRGADERFIRSLADDVLANRRMTRGDRQTTFKLLYIVSAAILGESTARRIFHVESIIQDPNVQALISEWAEQGHAKGLEQGHAKGLEQGRAKGLEQGRVQAARQMLLDVLSARSFTVTRAVRARIKAESDIARLGSWHRAAVTASSIRDVFRAR